MLSLCASHMLSAGVYVPLNAKVRHGTPSDKETDMEALRECAIKEFLNALPKEGLKAYPKREHSDLYYHGYWEYFQTNYHVLIEKTVEVPTTLPNRRAPVLSYEKQKRFITDILNPSEFDELTRGIHVDISPKDPNKTTKNALFPDQLIVPSELTLVNPIQMPDGREIKTIDKNLLMEFEEFILASQLPKQYRDHSALLEKNEKFNIFETGLRR